MTRAFRIAGVLASGVVVIALVLLAVSLAGGRVRSGFGSSSEPPSDDRTVATRWPQPPSGRDPLPAIDSSPAAEPAPTGDGSDIILSPRERNGQVVVGSRFDRCTGTDSQYDELVDIEYVAPTVEMVVVGTITELGGTFYATSDHSVPSSNATATDVYRPTVMTVERILSGRLVSNSPPFAIGSRIKARLPGGQLGCDEYSSSRIGDIKIGERWVLFLDDVPTVDGKPADDRTIVRTWRLAADGRVVTASGERVSLDEFERLASAKP